MIGHLFQNWRWPHCARNGSHRAINYSHHAITLIHCTKNCTHRAKNCTHRAMNFIHRTMNFIHSVKLHCFTRSSAEYNRVITELHHAVNCTHRTITALLHAKYCGITAVTLHDKLLLMLNCAMICTHCATTLPPNYSCAFTMPAPPWVSHSVMDANLGNLGELSSWAESQALGSDILVAYKHQCTTTDWHPSLRACQFATVHRHCPWANKLK